MEESMLENKRTSILSSLAEFDRLLEAVVQKNAVNNLFKLLYVGNLLSSSEGGAILKEFDLGLVSGFCRNLVSRAVDSGLSHEKALEECAEKAKLWLGRSQEPVEPGSNVTYAGLREELDKLTASRFFTATPYLMVAAGETSFPVPMHESAGSSAPVATEEGKALASHYISGKPGFGFYPTEAELVCYYLKGKICNEQNCHDVISEIEIDKWDVEDLHKVATMQTSDKKWYFFCLQNFKRASATGFWKPSGNEHPIKLGSRVVGWKRIRVFYRNKPPHGDKTDWVMHVYRMDVEEQKTCQTVQGEYVLCKVFKRPARAARKNRKQDGAGLEKDSRADE